MKPVIPARNVDLKGRAFRRLKGLRKDWELSDRYANPGPIQYYGDCSTLLTETLLTEHKENADRVRSIEILCESIKTICNSGASDEVLEASHTGLCSIEKIINIITQQQ